MICLVEGELKYVMDQNMKLYVLMDGTTLMLQLSVGSLGFHLMVCLCLGTALNCTHNINYFSSLGAIPLVHDEFRAQQLHFPGVTKVSCTGSELHFSDCSYSHNIGDCDTAALICQGLLDSNLIDVVMNCQ